MFKKGSQFLTVNYCLTSLLSILDIIFEKLMYKRLVSYINKCNILYDKQFGFSSAHSTDHAILFIIAKIQDAIEDGLFSCGVFPDLSNAFNKVLKSHNFVTKLNHYGIRGLPKD